MNPLELIFQKDPLWIFRPPSVLNHSWKYGALEHWRRTQYFLILINHNRINILHTMLASFSLWAGKNLSEPHMCKTIKLGCSRDSCIYMNDWTLSGCSSRNSSLTSFIICLSVKPSLCFSSYLAKLPCCGQITVQCPCLVKADTRCYPGVLYNYEGWNTCLTKARKVFHSECGEWLVQ